MFHFSYNSQSVKFLLLILSFANLTSHIVNDVSVVRVGAD